VGDGMFKNGVKGGKRSEVKQNEVKRSEVKVFVE